MISFAKNSRLIRRLLKLNEASSNLNKQYEGFCTYVLTKDVFL